MSVYPPYQHSLIDGRTGLVSRPWERFFLEMSRGPVGPTGPEGPAGPPGEGLTILGTVPSEDDLPPTGAPGDAWITADDGHLWVWDEGTSSWLDLGALAGASGGYWEPLTNGDVAAPELIFAGGDVVMCQVTT